MARNHGFSDGNKRTARVIARVFLADDAIKLEFFVVEAIRTMEQTAGRLLSESELAHWFRKWIVR
ncbi:Fic family protein [Glaciimonas sp. PAMC28666]|uniref:Fic family protein n=1 Tax=Glaciimonas sp. PAMC28666 TaxID=2807626 RepID=UPI001F033ED0|nr:Fic family protein [Glaciimonas sp. PAMC28666]